MPEEQSDPTIFCWAFGRQKYGVDRRYEQELIDGVRMDLEFRPYQTRENLEDYCYHVASTVGLLSMPVIGLAPGVSFEQAAPYAIKLGISLQLTNFLRDVGEDARMGRVYLPETDLLHFRLTQQDIHNQVFDQRFIALMQFEIGRAHQLYQEALPGIAMLSSAARPAVGAAAMHYAAILDEIEAKHYQVYQFRAHTSTWLKIMMLPAIIFRVLHSPRLKRPPVGKGVYNISDEAQTLLVSGTTSVKAKEYAEARQYLELLLRIDADSEQCMDALYWLSEINPDTDEKHF